LVIESLQGWGLKLPSEVTHYGATKASPFSLAV
jgi:hypothetical protein